MQNIWIKAESRDRMVADLFVVSFVRPWFVDYRVPELSQRLRAIQPILFPDVCVPSAHDSLPGLPNIVAS